MVSERFGIFRVQLIVQRLSFKKIKNSNGGVLESSGAKPYLLFRSDICVNFIDILYHSKKTSKF